MCDQCLVLCGNFASLKVCVCVCVCVCMGVCTLLQRFLILFSPFFISQHKTVWSSLLEDAEKRKVYYHLEEHDAQVDGQQMVKNIMERLRMT